MVGAKEDAVALTLEVLGFFEDANVRSVVGEKRGRGYCQYTVGN